MKEKTEFQKQVPQIPEHLHLILSAGHRQLTEAEEAECSAAIQRAMEIGRPIAMRDSNSKTGRHCAAKGLHAIPRAVRRKGGERGGH